MWSPNNIFFIVPNNSAWQRITFFGKQFKRIEREKSAYWIGIDEFYF